MGGAMLSHRCYWLYFGLRSYGREAYLLGRYSRKSAGDWNMNPERVRIFKLHKGWADRYAMIWVAFGLLLMTGIQFALDHAGIDAADRIGVLLLIALIVILVAIWQAVGLGIARIHMIVRGIDLEH